MLFFSKNPQLPTFTGSQSKIALSPPSSRFKTFHHPEKGSSGYFLALDKDKDGKITKKRELFGDEKGKFKNGFEALRAHDKNKDGKIDSKDPVFHELLLWKDANSNGISEKKELFKAKKKVISISLNYKDNEITQTKGALAIESSTFKYKKGKRVLAGKVLDVWFFPFIKE